MRATLTPEAKIALSKTVRALRRRLLVDLREEAEREYRLAIKDRKKAELPERQRERRRRLEESIEERTRAGGGGSEASERAMVDAVKEAASTLLNRLVLVKHLEALGLSAPKVVTGGWESRGFKQFREFAPGLYENVGTGYQTLPRLLFEELAAALPGLFGDVGLTRLFSVPVSTLRHVIEQLDAPELEGTWADDTTLGWVYQYWNDPEREELDAQLHSTRSCTAPEATWRTASRSSSSACSPTGPALTPCAPTSCGSGSPPSPTCCSTCSATSASEAPS